MGLDWTALEQGLHRVALQKSVAIMAEHPGHTFYGLALHGVPTEEDGELVLPVLALNSQQALARDAAEDDDDLPEDEDEDDWEEEEGGDYRPPPMDGSDPEDEEDDDDEDVDDDDSDSEDTDDSADEDGGGFYSRRWDPSEWHWNAVALVDDAAAGVWERAFAEEVKAKGWEATAQTYYELMVRVIKELRQSLLASKGVELVCFVADDDHAERLLKASLTSHQLATHFPDLAAN